MPAHQRPMSALMVPGSVYFWGHVHGGTVLKLFYLVVVHARRGRGGLRCDHPVIRLPSGSASADGLLYFRPGMLNSSVVQSENARIAGERKV